MADSTIEVLIKVRSTAEKVIAKLNADLKKAGSSAGNLGNTSTSKLESNLNKVDSALKGVDSTAKKADSSIKAAAQTRLTGLNAQISRVKTNLKQASTDSKLFSTSLKGIKAQGRNLLPRGLLSGLFTGAVIKAAGDFSIKIAEISTLVDSAITPTQELRQTVSDLSIEFNNNRTDTAAALYQAISGGAEQGAEANKLLRDALVLARAGVTSAEDAVGGLTTVINSFGLEMSEADKVADILFTTVKAGRTTVSQLSTQFFQTAPLAALLGVSLEEVSAAVVGLTKTGAKTSVVMTQLRAALQGISSSEGAANLFRRLGFESAQAAIKQRGFQFALNAVAAEADGQIPQLQKLVGSIEGVGAVLGLTGEKAVLFSDALDKVRDSNGAAQEAADKVRASFGDRLNSAFTKLSSVALALGQAIGEFLLPALELLASGAQALQSIVEAFPDVAGTVGTLVTTLILLKSALGVANLISNFRNLLLASSAAAQTAGASAITLGGILGGLRTALLTLFASTGVAGFVAVAAAIGVVAVNVLGVIKNIEKWAEAEKVLTDVETEKLEIIKELNKEGAGDVQIKSAEDLSKLTREQNKLYTDQLKTRFELVSSEISLFIAQGQSEKLIQSKKREQEEILAAAQASVKVEEDFANAASGATGNLKDQAIVIGDLQKALSRSTADAKALTDAQTQLSQLRYDTNINQLTRVRNAQIKVLEIKEDLPGLTEVYKRHFADVSQLASQRASDLKEIAVQEVEDITAIQLASAGTDEERARISIDSARNLSNRIIDISKQEIDTINNLRQEAATKLQQLSEKSISIAAEISSVETQGENRLRELRRRGLTEAESFEDRKREIAELTSKFNQALAAGDFDTAKQLANRQISLSGQLVGEVKEGEQVIVSREQSVQDAIAQTDAAQQRLVASLQAQKKEVDAAKASQEQLLANLDETLTKLSTALENFSGNQLSIESELQAPDGSQFEADIRSIIARVQEGLLIEAKLNIQANVSRTGNLSEAPNFEEPPGFANGTPGPILGSVRGPGTSKSDSILARLSRGEFVVKAAAVKRYGSDLFRSLNSLNFNANALPGFAEGGLFGAPSQPVAASISNSTIGGVSTGAPFNIVLPNGDSLGPFTGNESNTDTLRGTLSREALKFGRRGR